MKKEKKHQVVIIGGFGGSGSSAAVDLLREFDTFQDLNLEFRVLVDPDGILNLENNLINNWTPFQSDMAIKRFKKLINRLTKKNIFPYFRVDLTRKFGKDFISLSNKYIYKLISFSYSGMWLGINNPIWWIYRKFKQKFVIKFFNYYKPIYISFKKEQFIDITKNYLKELFESNINDKKINYIILDEVYASLNPSRVLKYFDCPKMIIVHRDPRDTFVGALKNEFHFIPHEVGAFINWYECLQKQTRSCTCENEKILRLNFEDLVLKYNETVKIILEFLDAKNYKHFYKKKYFNPDISIKNIEIWKDYKNQHEIELIYNNLKEYCYKY